MDNDSFNEIIDNVEYQDIINDREYEKVMNIIYAETMLANPIEATDNIMLDSIKSQNIDSDPEYGKRNQIYTMMLSHYLESYKNKDGLKSKYKKRFFNIVMIAFCAIIIASIAFIYIVATSDDGTSSGDIAMIIGSFSGIASALFIIPKVIAEHLFPKDEDSYMIDMVKSMQINDTGIRNMFNAKKDENDLN